ncbi:MAG: T9SS type A sorting domain-containing protein [Bacteroidota bacterium]
MKIKTALFFTMLFISLKGFTQFVPIGAQWYYGTSDPNGTSIYSFYKYECTKDTIINGDQYSKISFTNDKGNNPFNINYLITKQNSKIYYWLNNAKKLLFDLNAKLGDTINLDLCYSNFNQYGVNTDSSYNLNIKITQISWIKNYLNANDSLRAFGISILSGQTKSGGAVFTDKLINSNVKMNYSLINITGSVIMEGSNYLRCYQDSSYNFKSTITGAQGQVCDYSNVGVNEIYLKKNVSFYPNPTTSELHIETTETEKLTAQFFDITGKQVMENILLTNTTTINTSSLNEGMYFVRITNADGVVIKTQKVAIVR